MKLKRVYWVTCVLAVLFASVAGATTIVVPTDEALVAKSPVIVRGTVMESKPVDRNGAIYTETRLAVDEVLKGRDVDSVVTIRELGGQIGNRVSVVFGAPEYAEGEQVLVFLWRRADGDYQTRDLLIGKFTAIEKADRTIWHRNENAANTVLLGQDLEPIQAPKVHRDAALFEKYVRERAAGRPAVQDYGVADSSVTSDFTMISEPTIYRWFAFQNGGSAGWYHYGSQPGYSGGGVNELQTGMNSWTGYSEANIRYTYVGQRTSSPGGLDAPNGANEVLFNDPKAEIDGSWSPSTGGVVGRGGFNGVTVGGSWTSPFTADASHPQKTYTTTYNITEGNLTIQDGVSPGAGISSTRLAEILAHEFGHTLGFGHSADSSALMYYSVTGLGPSLRADDQMAARWLYPGSGSTQPPPQPTAPAAPSNLAATSASQTSIQLQWRDNASDETSQVVFMAIGNGGFSAIGSVGANVTSTLVSSLQSGTTYRFYIVARNSAGDSAASNTASATTTAAATVQAAFTVSPGSGTAGVTTFTFTNQSTGSITSYNWNFGDGTTSTQINPTKIYASAGTYTITLTVAGGGASSSTSQSVSVGAQAVPVAASFSFSPSNPTTDNTVSFFDESTGSITSWNWSFGDGSSSTFRNPTKRYTTPGSYNVTLTVRNSTSSNSTNRTVTVTSPAPATPPVSAAFNFSPVSPVAGQAVSFIDSSSGSPTAWAWNFGDGGSSSQQNPQRAFTAPGSYLVSLTVSNAVSSNTTTRTITVSSSASTYRSLVPVSAQTSGVGGSEWRTELSVYNAGGSSANVQFLYIPGAGGSILTRSASIGPNQTLSYQNALPELFGLSVGAGAIAIEATSNVSTPVLKVSSRTFTNGPDGTYGQFVPDVARQMPKTLYITGIESNGEYRTNIGLVNQSGSAATVALTLYDSAGAVVASANAPVAAQSFQQTPLTSMFPAAAGRNLSALSLKMTANITDAVTGYASVVDNRTQDPVYIQATALRPNGEVVVPVVGRTAGANGTYWRSDATIYNPNSSQIYVTATYYGPGADNGKSRSLYVNAGRTTKIQDVVTWIGASASSGTLKLTSNGGSAPIVTTRTYTARSWDNGTFGQSIDPAESFGRDQYVTGLRSDGSYRTNVGFVNNGDQTLGVTVTLRSLWGTTASAFVSIAPYSQQQVAMSQLFPNVNVSALGSFTIHAHTDTAATLFAYGSVVDNTSGDPVFISGE